MSKSRYSFKETLDGKQFKTFRIPTKATGLAGLDLLAGVKTTEYVIQAGDRIDHLAAKYYNDDTYWWIIALCNNIAYPFASGGFTIGRVLKIPVDVNSILQKLQ